MLIKRKLRSISVSCLVLLAGCFILTGCQKKADYLYPSVGKENPLTDPDTPPGCKLSPLNSPVQAGKTARVEALLFGNVTKFTINGVDKTPASGDLEFPTTAPGNVFLDGVVEGPGGKSTCTTYFVVVEALECKLTANPNPAKVGDSVAVEIVTTGTATKAQINSISVAPNGGMIFIPASQIGVFTATGTVSNANGSSSCSIQYEVIGKPPKYHQFTKLIKDVTIYSDIDILWVIDNSNSMDKHQKDVIQNTQSFMQAYTKLPNLNWKMGLISTTYTDSEYIGMTPATLLSAQSPDPVTAFQTAVGKLGTKGTGFEKSFKSTLAAMGKYPDFFRKDSFLALIYISDAPEQSWEVAKDVTDAIIAKKGDLKRTSTYAVLGAKDLGCTDIGEGEWSYAGSEYENIVKATKGKAYPLCSAFGSSLLDIANQVISSATLVSEIVLPAKPFPQTIEVRYKGALLPSGPAASGGKWIYDTAKNAVVFHDLSFATGNHEEVEIKFQEDY